MYLYSHKKETMIYKKAKQGQTRTQIKQKHKQRWRTKQLTDLVCDSEFLSVVGA